MFSVYVGFPTNEGAWCAVSNPSAPPIIGAAVVAVSWPGPMGSHWLGWVSVYGLFVRAQVRSPMALARGARAAKMGLVALSNR